MALTQEQLDLLDQTKQVHVETSTSDTTRKTIIWVVVSEGSVYVRSVDGADGHWYQRALANPRVAIEAAGERIEFRAIPVVEQAEIDAVSGALRDKYPAGGSLDRMTRDEVLDTTLRLEPA